MGRSKEHGQLTSEGGVHPDLERQAAQLEGSRGKGDKGRGRTGISIDIETDSKQSKERSHQGQKASELQRKGKHSSDSQGKRTGRNQGWMERAKVKRRRWEGRLTLCTNLPAMMLQTEQNAQEQEDKVSKACSRAQTDGSSFRSSSRSRQAREVEERSRVGVGE
jgi:hypothetical protein